MSSTAVPGAEPGEALRTLAAAYGVATEYWDQGGGHHTIAAGTLTAVLAGLGVQVADEDDAWRAVEQARLAPWRRTLPPVVVAREGDEVTCPVHVPHGAAVRLRVLAETGEVYDAAQREHVVAPVEVDGALVGEASFGLPAHLAPGYHRLEAQVEGRAPAVATLVVTPRRLELPDAVKARRLAGLAVQLYSVRSRRSWGTGDLVDLADLLAWSALEAGADLVQVNPVHAASPVLPVEPSPYLPVSRRFGSPLYVRVEAAPEHAYLDAADRDEVARLAAGPRAASRTADLLDRDSAWAARAAALALVHRVPRSPGREACYRAFLAREGGGLVDFATWCALVEAHGDPEHWPAELGDPAGAVVAAERRRLAERVDFHQWCQWVLDEQLGRAQETARACGMAVGVMHDLAVGVHPYGADVWALGPALVSTMSVGAPPDMYNQIGQDWSQPPWHPSLLVEAAYEPYRAMLRSVLRHCGAVRVDHVLGLFRLWWVPRGRPPGEGTYVRYDHRALVGILALEAQRAGAVVVGEDLGTVEDWMADELREHGILGTSILFFERREGRVPDPADVRPYVLGAVTTHDLPPTPAYLAGEHVRLRGSLGLLTRSVEDERREHEQEVATWRTALVGAGLLDPDGDDDALVLALHRWLGRTRAPLVSVALTDVVGDRTSQNQPGTHHEHPNWQRPLTDGAGRPVLLEDLRADRVRAFLDAAAGRTSHA